MRSLPLLALALAVAACAETAHAQVDPAAADGDSPLVPAHRGLELYVGADSQALFRPILINQFWAKATHNNPGTATRDGDREAAWSPTLGVRRVRLLVLAELGDRVQAFAQLGINNQTFATGGGSGTGGVGGYGQAKKPQVFVHDAWGQYRVAYRPKAAEGAYAGFPSSLYVGAGLHYYHGLSRLSQAGVPTGMLLDFPIVNFPDVERGSQFARQFGVYAKGDVRRLHYRVAVNQPFVNDGRPPARFGDRDPAAPAPGRLLAVDYPTDNLAYTAYAEWRFGEWEGHTLPFRPFTYLGSKRLLNLGAGFYAQPHAVATYDVVDDGQGSLTRIDDTHAKAVWSVDAYAEQPGATTDAFTAYLVHYGYDFGPGYYRSFGLLNTAPGAPAADFAGEAVVDGFGNAEPLMGTGGITHLQGGYLWPGGGGRVRFQTYAAVTRKDLDFLGVATYRYDLGANLFLGGHAAKVSANVALRPQVFARAGGFEAEGHRGEVVVQAQVAL